MGRTCETFIAWNEDRLAGDLAATLSTWAKTKIIRDNRNCLPLNFSLNEKSQLLCVKNHLISVVWSQNTSQINLCIS